MVAVRIDLGGDGVGIVVGVCGGLVAILFGRRCNLGHHTGTETQRQREKDTQSCDYYWYMGTMDVEDDTVHWSSPKWDQLNEMARNDQINNNRSSQPEQKPSSNTEDKINKLNSETLKFVTESSVSM